jgi:hypothetical protein
MPRPRNRRLINPLLWVPILLGLPLLGVGLAIAHNQGDQIVGVALSELGLALLIAAVVSLLFEESAKRDSAKSIIAFLYGIDTEKNYFKMIEDYIVRCPFYREGTKVIYRFVELHQESYLIEYEIEYCVKNVSQIDKLFAIEGEVQTQSIYVKNVGSWKLGVNKIEFTWNYGLPKAYTEPIRFKTGKGSSSPYSQTFKSDSIVLPPKCGVHVRIVHSIAKHDHDSDVWQSAIPCSGVTLRLEWQKRWGLTFAHEAIHPDSEFMKPEPGEEGTTCWKELTLNRPFMVRHGIHFSWSS